LTWWNWSLLRIGRLISFSSKLRVLGVIFCLSFSSLSGMFEWFEKKVVAFKGFWGVINVLGENYPFSENFYISGDISEIYVFPEVDKRSLFTLQVALMTFIGLENACYHSAIEWAYGQGVLNLDAKQHLVNLLNWGQMIFLDGICMFLGSDPALYWFSWGQKYSCCCVLLLRVFIFLLLCIILNLKKFNYFLWSI